MKSALLFSTVALFAAAPLSAQGVTMKEDKPGLKAKAKVTADAATATAQAKVPKGKIVAAEIEEEKGKLIYSFDLKTDGKSGIDEVNVDAITGTVIAVTHESPAAEKKEADADKKPAGKKAETAKKP